MLFSLRHMYSQIAIASQSQLEKCWWEGSCRVFSRTSWKYGYWQQHQVRQHFAQMYVCKLPGKEFLHLAGAQGLQRWGWELRFWVIYQHHQTIFSICKQSPCALWAAEIQCLLKMLVIKHIRKHIYILLSVTCPIATSDVTQFCWEDFEEAFMEY